jgi:uncharacterized membrane protein
MWRIRLTRALSAPEKREMMGIIFSNGLVLLAIFLAFIGVLAAVKPSIQGVSYLGSRFEIAVYACLAGVLLSALVSVTTLIRLSGHVVRTDFILLLVYLLIASAVVATFALWWAISP